MSIRIKAKTEEGDQAELSQRLATTVLGSLNPPRIRSGRGGQGWGRGRERGGEGGCVS